MANAESKPFLGDSDFQDDENVRTETRSRVNFRLILLHTSIIAIYTTIFALSLRRPREQTAVHPIADLNIKYVPVTPPPRWLSPYSGQPSEEIDQAWHDLLQNMNLRVSKAELEANGQESISLPEGGGYLAWIGAQHQMHCIKMLRKWSYRDHYYPNYTAHDQAHWELHSDHCFELLRTAAMCHGDTTLTTFYWGDQKRPEPDVKSVPYRCVDWEALMSSVQNRIVTAEEMERLNNPGLSPG